MPPSLRRRYWELLVNLTRREVKGRYSQSFFGFAWAIAQPLATMAVFTFVFSRLARSPSDGAPYPLFAYAALVPWFFFSNSVNSGMMSLITYRNIVTKTYFPARDHSARAGLLALPGLRRCRRALRGDVGLLPRSALGRWALMAPLFFLLLVAFTFAVTLLTSATNVFYRDVNPVVHIALQLWLYLTPVAYPLSTVPEGTGCSSRSTR